MKKFFLLNIFLYFIYFLFVLLFNRLFSASYWPLYLGGLVGIFLPYVDQFLYIFVFKPIELTSQRITTLYNEKRYKEMCILIFDTREERKDLIFHSTNFQIIFAVLTFWVVTSSGNLFGRGLVLGFFLNLVMYLFEKFKQKEIKEYFYIAVGLLILFGIMI